MEQENPPKVRTLTKEESGFLLSCLPPLSVPDEGYIDHWEDSGASRTLFSDETKARAAYAAAIPREYVGLRATTRIKHWEIKRGDEPAVMVRERCRPYGEYLKDCLYKELPSASP